MLLIIEALLLILGVLGQDQSAAAVEGQLFPLDMALDSVDDQYLACGKKMAYLVRNKYLKKEINNSTEFKKAWKEGEENARAPEDKLTKNHSIALYVYTNLNSSIYHNFDMAVYNGKQDYRNRTFKWYSLKFLLTDAIQILTKKQKKCKSTYRGTKAEFYKNVTGTEVRFGSFASSSLDRKVAQGFGTKSCFEIKTCYGADVIKYSKYPEQKEVLIPPNEMFKVTAVKTRKDLKNLWCETVYKLESSGDRSDLNCSVAFDKPFGFKCRCSKSKGYCRMYGISR
ncbi:ecto-ADP-ribosyltransferase 5-like [Siphateles boraxobius]|uniref:ecto-ADP-ribosyltransferase 5-like n=1 Tax=Siphateles boraxobius TaxID=180520 RepID=UPI004063456F